MNKKDRQRKDFIAKHGRCCDTCDNEPTNQGLRCSCLLIDLCKEEDGYPHYTKAKKIYSIDVKYCC